MKNTKESIVSFVQGLLAVTVALALIYFFIGRPYVSIYNGVSLDTYFSEESRGGIGVHDKVHQITDEYLTIQHKLFWFIPFYKDHYYLVFNDNLTNCIAVRATPKWAEQFEDGYSEEGVVLKGYVQKYPWKGFFSDDLYSPAPEDVLQQHIDYWNSIGFYPEVEEIYYIEPRPFFNLKTISTIMDFIFDLIGGD